MMICQFLTFIQTLREDSSV